ncbi:MAG: response regulator [Mariprofundaceae bacterium]
MSKQHEGQAEILIVEDEPPIARLMALHLRAAGWSVRTCADGREAMNLLREGGFRLLVLDRMLPGTGGMQILRWLRGQERLAAMPVLMVTALSMPSERVHGLNEGADDYLCKPFEPEELVARVRSLLRRVRSANAGDEAAAGVLAFRLDEEAPFVIQGKARVELRPLEYKLLKTLMEQPGKTRSREWLLDHVWGRDAFVEPRTVDVTVKRLRKALKAIGQEACVETVRGMGYRFVSPID